MQKMAFLSPNQRIQKTEGTYCTCMAGLHTKTELELQTVAHLITNPA